MLQRRKQLQGERIGYTNRKGGDPPSLCPAWREPLDTQVPCTLRGNLCKSK